MAFLIFVLVVSAVGITVVLVRNRPRTTIDASIEDFERGLKALSPEPGARRGARPPKSGVQRPA